MPRIVAIALVLALLGACTASAQKAAERPTAVDLFKKVVNSVSVPEAEKPGLANVLTTIQAWQHQKVDKRRKKGVAVFAKSDSTLPGLLTPAVIEQALGKPDGIGNGKIPFLFTKDFKIAEGPIYWYGETGFCFGVMDESKDPYLWMLSQK